MTEEELNKFLESHMEYYFINNMNNFQGNFIYHNLPIFYKITKIVKEYISNTRYENITKFSSELFSKMNLFEKIELLKDFFEEINMDIDLEKIINNGTIKPVYLNFKTCSLKKYLKAFYKKLNNNDSVKFNESNLTLDFLVMVHELNHYSNSPSNGDSAYILSESLAIYAEQMACNYLMKKGYNYEVEFFRKIRLNNIRECIESTIGPLEAKLTYITFGKVTEENFHKLFKNEDYNSFLNGLQSKEDFSKIVIYLRYIFGYLLASYMVVKVKGDYSFYQNIKNLNNSINDINFYDALKKIEIYDLNYETINMLYDCLIEANFINNSAIKKVT